MFKKTLVCLLIALMFVGVWFEALEVTIAAQTQPKITLIKSLDELGEVPKIQRESPEKPGVNKWAVIIGIANYRGWKNDLWNPDEDAKEMYWVLINKYGFPRENIIILLNRRAKARRIIAAINWLKGKENSGSTVVFFYSGHGARVEDGRGWDSDVESDGYDEGIVSFDMYGISDGMLKELFSDFESTKIALIFSCCHAGGMIDSYGDDLQASGRVIATACKADQYGWDMKYLKNTLFAYYFVDEGMIDGKADSNGDGVVSVEEAFWYAKPLVEAAAPEPSEPQIYDGYSGELVP